MKFLKLEMAFIAVFAVMVFAAPKVWTGKLAEKFDGGTGKIGDPYLISTAEQFALMASKSDTAIYYKLTENIVLNEGDASEWAENPPANKWTVYGTLEKPVYFHLDGDRHTVSGLYVNSTDSIQGLFGVFIGTISNLNLVNGYVKGGELTGALAGIQYCNPQSLYYSGCSTVRDSVDVYVEGENFVGGVFGAVGRMFRAAVGLGEMQTNWGYAFDEKADYQDIVFSGTVVGNQIVGGVTGYFAEGPTKTTASNFVNRGKVIGKKWVGGVIGMNYADLPNGASGPSPESMIKDLKNFGEVKGDHGVGGVIGVFWFFRSTTPRDFANHEAFFNFGSVTANTVVGGVVGLAHGYRKSKIRHSYNAGSVVGTDSVGGVFGFFEFDDENSKAPLDSMALTCLNFGEIIQKGTVISKKKSIEEANAMLTPSYPFVADVNKLGENLGYPLYIYSNHLDLLLPKGTGKKYDPFLISNEQDLFAFTLLAQNYESIRPIDTLHFKQTADIEWSGKYDWFIDSLKNIYYDGGDHVISGLKINRPDQDTVGFARVLGKVVISHLTFKNFEVNGRSFVGMLAGINGYGVIHNMSFYGTVQGDSIVGGVCGKSEWTTTNILSFVDVFGKNMVGGMFGLGFGYLINSASFGNVKGDSLVGGISGRVTTSYSSLYKNVYAVNDVDARTHGGVFAYNINEKEPSKLHGLYYKKGKNEKFPCGVALDDSIMKSDAFLDSLIYFVKDSSANSKEYPVPRRYKGHGSATSPYILEKVEDLYFFDSLYTDSTFKFSMNNMYQKYAHYKLTTDVNMNKNRNHKWIPISEFHGTLDGNYHVINNMNVMDTGAVAIFSSFEGSIKNLGIRNSYFWGTFAAPFAANFWGSIENCWNENTTVKGSEVAGGIVGRFRHRAGMKGVDSLKIENVYNTGNINSTHYAGGIMGSFVSEYSRDTNTYVISNVYNRGEITTFSGYGWIGQISSGGRALRIHLLKNSYNTDKMCSSFHIGDGFLETTFQNNYVLWNDECTIDWFPHFRKADYMQSADFVKELGDAFEMDKDGVNDGFPILKGLKPRTDYSPELDKTDSTVTIREVAKIENRMLNLQVESVGRFLNVNGVKPGTTLKVYDLKGNLVQSVQVNNKSVSLTVNKAGVLVISNAGRTRIVKVN